MTTEKFGDHTTIERTGRVVLVRFDRGDGLNALSFAFMKELTNVAKYLAEDFESSAIVLSGQGAFSAGADLKDPTRKRTNVSLQERRHIIKAGPDLCQAWEDLEQVTIAAVEKFCIGGGVALAISCDHRIAGEGSHFRLPEIPLGMNMSWRSNPRTVNLLGHSRAKLFTILGERLEAPKALEWGMIDEMVPDGGAESTALALAEKYAALPPIPVRMTKQGIDAAAKALNYATSYMDRDQFALASTTEDQKESVAAFLEKRKPAFKGN